MSQTLKEVGPKAAVAQVEFAGEKMVLPVGMSIKQAKDLLTRREQYLEEQVDVRADFDVFPWDGAYALDVVLTEKFGWSPATATPSFFGPQPPKLITIDVGPNEQKQVPWGAFSLPGVDGLLHTSVGRRGARFVFAMVAQVKRKDEETVKDIINRVRKYLKDNSIYRGKAIKIRFRDDSGDALGMPEPKFLDTSLVKPEQLVFSRDVHDAIETSLFTPITRVADCLANDIPVKRGVLLGGTFGTGKTLAAHVASKLAVEHGITYVYVPRADELADAIEFAKQYQSPACVVFCEDVDRVMSGERDVQMDDILNIIDGIDTKRSHIITVLTTNELKAINPAMLRPGRLDAVIEVLPPDAEAVQRLLRLYAGGAVSEDTDLSAVGQELAGNIPAVIEEVVKRAKLAQLRLQPRGEKVRDLSEGALMVAAKGMSAQTRLLRDASAPKMEPVTLDSVMSNVVENVVAEKVAPVLESMKERMEGYFS